MKRFFDRLTFFGGGLLAAYLGLVRPRLARWNASDDEVLDKQTGDELVPHPLVRTTRSINIQAPAKEVWQWIVQIGYGRGGFYSYDALERAAGLTGIRSATKIEPELQKLAVGDEVRLSPVTPMTVKILRPKQALVLQILMSPTSGEALERRAEPWMDWTWAFLITPLDDASCRLTSRVRATYAPYLPLWPMMALLAEPASFVMDRKLLLTVKQRAEENQAQPGY